MPTAAFSGAVSSDDLHRRFGTVNAIDCRTENELYVGETGNWRVQKLTLRSN